jgi:hypothetical protein
MNFASFSINRGGVTTSTYRWCSPATRGFTSGACRAFPVNDAVKQILYRPEKNGDRRQIVYL